MDSITEKYLDHINYCHEYLNEYDDDSLYVDYRKLYLAVKSAYDDIERYKNYHFNDPAKNLSNAVKRSAYMCKWICRFMPISQKKTDDFDSISNTESVEELAEKLQDLKNLNDPSILFINIGFSLQLAQIYITDELNEIYFQYKAEYYDEFCYDLIFRQLGDDGLLHIFQNIFTAVKAQRAGVLEFYE